MRIWNFKILHNTAVLFMLLFALIFLPILLSCGPIELGADTGFTINVEECQPFSMQFSATSTSCPLPVLFYWVIGDLPPYATLDENTGLLTGCPQVGDPSASFFVGVSEFSPPACGPYLDMNLVTINVIPTTPVCDMVIDPVWYPVAWEGYPFSIDLSVTGGVGPFTWDATGLPAGLTISDPVNGIIDGFPAAGTCGTYTVTATVTDTGTCCCPSVNRGFMLIVDCWANYPPILYYPTACNFSVQIGTGLTQGQTIVLIDGSQKATLTGGQSNTFTSVPCQSHVVMVSQTVSTADPNTRFSVIGSNIKQVTNIDNLAYFDYAREVRIDTASDPPGLTQPPGAGFYAVGGFFSSTVPSTIKSQLQNGTKYVFRQWRLPDGSTSPNINLVFPVNNSGTAVAEYDNYYLLTLKSKYPPINETSWEKANSTATWNLSLHAVPMESPFLAFLGGTLSPVNSTGSQFMGGPTTVDIIWRPNYTGPIIATVILLLVIIGIIALTVRLKATGTKK